MNRQNRLKWFQTFNDALFPYLAQHFDLLSRVRVGKKAFEEMKAVSIKYLTACLGRPNDFDSEESFLAYLDENIGTLANLTLNGALIPKKEFQKEFNELHRVTAAWLKSLRIDRLLYQAFCPITLRLTKGKGDPKSESTPYATTKIHADLWNGDPADNINVIIPVMGDVARTTAEFFKPPDNFEEKLLKVMNDYDEGNKHLGKLERYPFEFLIGHAHFMDALLLHRTVRKGGGNRIAIHFELRRKTDERTRKKLEAICDPRKLEHYVDLEKWYRLGTTKYMAFVDTFADAKKGIFVGQQHMVKTYVEVDRL